MDIQKILDVSKSIDNGRDLSYIFTHLVEEVGELATELAIETGKSYKAAGEDGIVGEAVDAIICLIDIISMHQPEVTPEQLDAIMQKKLNKWIEKCS